MAFLASIVGAIGSFFGAVGSFLGGLGFVGKALLGIGLNLAAQYLLRKNQRPEPSGIQLQVQYGTDTPRQVACGLVGIAGHDIHVNTYGADNKWLQWVFQLSDYPIDGLSRLAINGEWVTLDYDNPHPTRGWPVAGSEFSGRAWLKIYDGRQTAADSGLVSAANPSDRWTKDHIGVGCAYAILTAEYDREKPGGMPDLFFEVRGARLYDWRKDSTVGGSGPHRWDDPSTWEYTENPVVIAYNYYRGLSVNGDLFCGMGMDPADLPLDKYTIAANICDEQVNGRTRYRCSVMLDCTALHGENIEAIMKSCGGIIIDDVEGSWPMIGTAQPIVATITDDDLVVGQPVRFQAKRSMAELVNSISGTYPDPDQLWAMVGYETVTSNDAVAADRRTRDLGMDFPMVRDPHQAKQLASIYLRENRFEATAEITLRPRWITLKVGDWIQWNSARYGNRTYLITSTELLSLESNTPRCRRVSLQERSATIYDGVSPPNIVVPVRPAKPVYLQQVQGLLVSAVTAGANGKYMPAIQVTWSPITDVTVTGVEIQWYPVDDPSSVGYTSVPVDQSAVVLTDGVVSATEYKVQTRLITDPPRPVTWTAPVTVRTLDHGNTDIDRDEITNAIGDVSEWFGGNVRETIEELRRNALLTIDQDAANFRDKQELRRELSSTFGRARAQWRREIEVATGPDSALARRIEELEVEVGDNLAQAVSTLSTQISEVNGSVQALSQDLTELQAQVDDDIATAVSGLQMQITSANNAINALSQQLTDLEVEVENDIATAVSGLQAQITAVNGALTSLSQALTDLEAEVEGDIATAVSNLQAQITSTNNAVTALSSQLTALETQIDDDLASAVSSLQSQISTVDGKATANATAISNLTAQVGDIASSVTIRGEASASPGGGWARYGVQVKTGSGDTWSSAGFFIDTDGSNSRVVFQAGQFVITDGTNNSSPFVFQSGTAFVENVRLGTLYFNQLKSTNEKLVMTGYGSNASIEIFN